jgi:hypothetical protein
MLPKSFDTADAVLEYTAIAANALHNVAVATQIPFLDSVRTLSLTLIPLVQVSRSGSGILSGLSQVVDHEVSKRPMPPYSGRDSPDALRPHELVHAFR